MAANTELLQGEVNEDPGGRKLDVERFLLGFLQALLAEQKASAPSVTDSPAQPRLRAGADETRSDSGKGSPWPFLTK
jgi:hypothetical protein